MCVPPSSGADPDAAYDHRDTPVAGCYCDKGKSTRYPRLQTPAQGITVIGFVSNQSLGILARSALSFSADGNNVVYRRCEQLDLRRRCRVQVVSQRNTLAVDHHHHPLRSFAPFSFSDALAPFFAGAKLPSANASDQSSSAFHI